MPTKASTKTRKEEKKARKRAREQGKVLVQQARKAGDAGSALRHDLIERVTDYTYRIKKGFVPRMNVEGLFYANEALAETLLEELVRSGGAQRGGAFTPAIQQAANVATLPGIVGVSAAMPDAHSGYGFCIGNVAAMDLSNPYAVVSPGGVGYDINCGVRLLRSNLSQSDITMRAEKIAEKLFERVPVGVGSKSILQVSRAELDVILNDGMKAMVEQGICWEEDLLYCEEGGSMKEADSNCVSARAKSRGLQQTGSLGSGNHYLEVQVIDEVYDEEAAAAMGLVNGQVCVMIHCGSRGLGHQVCTDYLTKMSKKRGECSEELGLPEDFELIDRQLACVAASSKLGQEYLAGMAGAANFAFVNRSAIAWRVRSVFEEIFKENARKLDLFTVYDVSHNIAKKEIHRIDGEEKELLVHRKGATRAFGPGHADLPPKYADIGQPVIVGGSMGTCSYVMVGTAGAMANTFGSTCHGAGRQMSRSEAKRDLRPGAVMKSLEEQGIVVKVASPNLICEEAPESYKDVNDVIDTCHAAGISKKVVKLRPLIVVKG